MKHMKTISTLHRFPAVIRQASCLGVILLVGLLTGCETTGLSLRETGQASYSHFVYQMARQQAAAAPKPRPLHRPVRLAVAQVGEVAPPSEMLQQLRQHPDIIASVTALPLPGEGRASTYGRPGEELGLISENTTNRLTEVRTLARSLGADQIFIFGGSIDTRASRNAWAPLDFTLVGMTIFPSASVHAEGKAAGVLIDVESGGLRGQVQAEQKKQGSAPSAFAGEKTDAVRVKVRDALAASLADELIQKLREL
jgi:hypothetical protein